MWCFVSLLTWRACTCNAQSLTVAWQELVQLLGTEREQQWRLAKAILEIVILQGSLPFLCISNVA